MIPPYARDAFAPLNRCRSAVRRAPRKRPAILKMTGLWTSYRWPDPSL